MPIVLEKIISGGQTGADRAGLYAAEELGLAFGGCIPADAKTDEGSDWELVKRFGLTVHSSPLYPPRTEVNVVGSDGTVIFGNIYSPGSLLTQRLCLKYHKPFILNPTHEGFRLWLDQHQIRVLNVAGNRERTNKGIYGRVMLFLLASLKGYLGKAA